MIRAPMVLLLMAGPALSLLLTSRLMVGPELPNWRLGPLSSPGATSSHAGPHHICAGAAARAIDAFRQAHPNIVGTLTAEQRNRAISSWAAKLDELHLCEFVLVLSDEGLAAWAAAGEQQAPEQE
jgi:hypothetical protein